MSIRPLDELEALILRHLASGPCSASELTDALRASSQAHGLTITHARVTYRLGGLVSLRLVGSAERKLPGQRRDFLYSLRPASQASPKAEPAPPAVPAPLVVAEPPTPGPLVNTNTPTNTTNQHPAEVAPPRALTKAELAARPEMLRQRHQALIAQGKIKRRA